MVNEVVGAGDWTDEESLGETWKGRNVFSYGRNEGNGEGITGTARPEVLDKLLLSTERVVQEIDSVSHCFSFFWQKVLFHFDSLKCVSTTF